MKACERRRTMCPVCSKKLDGDTTFVQTLKCRIHVSCYKQYVEIYWADIVRRLSLAGSA